MFDGVATLKAYSQPTYDANRNEHFQVTEREVYVRPRGVYSSEYYSAAQLGLRPSITLEIAHLDDYQGEKVLEYEGREYTVIRVDWSAQRDKISLVCEERAENGQ